MAKTKVYRNKRQRLGFNLTSFHQYLLDNPEMSGLGLGQTLPKSGSAAGVSKRTDQTRKKARNGPETATGKRFSALNISTQIPAHAPDFIKAKQGEYRWCLSCDQAVPRKTVQDHYVSISVKH
jgi:hypothetical protein